MDYENKNKDAISTIKQALRQLATNGVPVGNMIKAINDIEEKYAESEDERIRNFLIKQANSVLDSITDDDEEVPAWKSALAWLEKQGEQKPVFEMKTPEESLGIDSETYNKIVDECVYGEQKPADKVEPKFEIGDLITNGILVGKIDEIHELGYHAYFGDHYADVPDIENWHKWTIQDAKDGDVLVSEYPLCGLGTWYCIFKSLDGDESMTVYCYLTRDGRFETKKELCFDKDPYNTKPATKEQRDQLEKAMSDAGYKWDAEHRLLRKIESRQDELTEFEKAVKQVVEEAIECGDTHNLKADADMLLRLVQKSSWGEEDIELLDNTIKFIEDRVAATSPSLRTYSPTLTGKEIPFLKAIKDRVQPKQEWSEEDDKKAERIIRLLQEAYDINCINGSIEWLKSLRPQSQWKPSDEQMDALRYVTNFDYGGYKATLVSLYEQLKKLRGE